MRQQFGLAAVALAVAVGLTACGGGGERTDSDDGQRGARTEAGSEERSDQAHADWPVVEPGHGQPVLRAVVSDERSGAIQVIDLASGDPVDTLEVDGQARLTPAGDDSHVIVAQSEEDVTHVLDTGIRWEAHGGHDDPSHVAPELVPGSLRAANPVHVVPHGDHVTVFADDEGEAYVLHQGETEAEDTIEADRPHHGVAVRLDDGQTLVSVPADDKQDTLPKGIRVLDPNGKPVQEFDNCPELHGEYAASDDVFVFGCADGLLVLERRDGERTWRDSKISNPADAKPDERAGAFVGDGTESVLGTFGSDAMLSIDLDRRRAERIELPDQLGAYLWDPYWEQGVVLTADGDLHAVDAEAAELTKTTEVTEPFELSLDYSLARPAIAPGERALYLTDPYTGRLLEIAISRTGFTPERSMPMDFTPFSLAVLGMADAP